MLFLEKTRSDSRHKSHIEGEYDFLDRSSRIEISRVRDFLNLWLSKMPEAEARQLISRMKSRDGRSFESASFEVILFAILSSLGCRVKIHPAMENGNDRRPDFHVATPDGDEFYVEAVLASEFDASEMAAEKRKNVVLQAIEKIDSPNFFIGIESDGNPDTPPSGKVLRGVLSKWLSNLNPDEVIREYEVKGRDALPVLEWQHKDWKIEFQAIPKKPERRGQGQRVIGLYSEGARWINSWEPIRDAILFKGGRYGELSKPYIIAVNVDSFALDRIDEMQALFGQEQFTFSQGDEEPEMRRARNGAWIGPKGPRYTRVTGAWLFGNLNPCNMVSRKNNLYINPRAKMPMPKTLMQLNHGIVSNDKMEWIEGRKLSDLLGLDPSWPE
jgi:hypothetical protein